MIALSGASVRRVVPGLLAAGPVFLIALVAPARPSSPEGGPVDLQEGQRTFVQVSTGQLHTCGLTEDGAAYCWGRNENGELGNGLERETREEPVPVTGNLTFRQISAGRAHTCGVTRDGAVYCWGRDDQGARGDGRNDPHEFSHPEPVPVQSEQVFTQVSAGDRQTCGVTESGTAYCWGANAKGQLGDGTRQDRYEPVAVNSEQTFTQVSVGGSWRFAYSDTSGLGYACGVTSEGDVYCWGNNREGQLGVGMDDGPMMCLGGLLDDCSRIPRRVQEEELNFIQVDAGVEHTCALTEDGTAYCWGENYYGQLGTGTDEDRTEPTKVNGNLTFADISAGFQHTCGITRDGNTYCWGKGNSGQFGDGTTGSVAERAEPGPTVGERDSRQISTGRLHTCEVAEGGRVYCWGDNQYGKLGTGSASEHLVPTAIAGFGKDEAAGPALVNPDTLDWAQVSSGGKHSCGLTPEGVAYCWGLNDVGQLGRPTDHHEPLWGVRVEGERTFRQITAGQRHSCGLATDGTAYCWGDHNQGQLGTDVIDTTGGESHKPVPVAGELSFTRISAGFVHTCGVTENGDAYCWGMNPTGALGDGTQTDRPEPVRVAGELHFTQVSAGYDHTCGVTEDGIAYCWGDNNEGQLGNGTIETRLEPVRVAGNHTFREVRAGNSISCGLAESGDAYCWGQNNRGQLGIETTEGPSTCGDPHNRECSKRPVRVQSNVTFARLQLGSHHACGVNEDDKSYCWGANMAGQVGDGTTTERSRPVPVSEPSRFVQISAGGGHSGHTCGVSPDNTAYCWGKGEHGRLGNRSELDRTEPTTVGAPPVRYAQLSVGQHTNCAMTEAGTIYCWGWNKGPIVRYVLASETEQLPEPRPLNRPQWRHMDSPPVDMDLGGDQACVLDAQNGAYCWGGNSDGALGLTSTPVVPSAQDIPGRVAGDHSFVQISTGDAHTCALNEVGQGYCWGMNGSGEVGNGTTGNYTDPVREPAPVAGGHTFREVKTGHAPPPPGAGGSRGVVGSGHSCGVTEDGTAYCWGRNHHGQLGDGSTDNRNEPTEVIRGRTFKTVALGDKHTCGVAEDGTAYCWGGNEYGQLGDGTHTDRHFPVPVSDDLSFTRISAGRIHSCGLTEEGIVYCWGGNTLGQVGDGTQTDRTTPVRVAGDLRFARVETGDLHTCGLTTSRTIYCWGFNRWGQLGIGTDEQVGDCDENCSNEPQKVLEPKRLLRY